MPRLATVISLFLLGLLAGMLPVSACSYAGPRGASAKSIEANWAFFDHVAVLRVVEVGRDRVEGTDGEALFPYVLFEVVKEYKGDLPNAFVNDGRTGAYCGGFPRVGSEFLTFFDAVDLGVRFSENPGVPTLRTNLNWQTKYIRIPSVSAADHQLRSVGLIPAAQ